MSLSVFAVANQCSSTLSMKDFIAEKSLCSYLVFINLKSCLVHDRDLSCLEEPPQLKKNTNKILFVFAERFSDEFVFPNLSIEVQVKQAKIQMKKSGLSLHTLIYNKLHSLIIYPLHDNLKFKLQNLAAAQFEQA